MITLLEFYGHTLEVLGNIFNVVKSVRGLVLFTETFTYISCQIKINTITEKIRLYRIVDDSRSEA